MTRGNHSRCEPSGVSPKGANVSGYYREKANVYFSLKQYDQAIEWACQAVALDSGDWGAHAGLIAALALTGHDVEAREALQRYLALPTGGPKTIAAIKASIALFDKPDDPGIIDFFCKGNGRPAQSGDAGGVNGEVRRCAGRACAQRCARY
jgi:hypothetical protein